MRVGDMNETICSRVRRKGSSTGRNQADWALRIGIVENDYVRFVIRRERSAHRPGPQAKFVAECVKLEDDILLHRIERDDRTAQSNRCTAAKSGNRHTSVRSDYTSVALIDPHPSYGQIDRDVSHDSGLSPSRCVAEDVSQHA